MPVRITIAALAALAVAAGAPTAHAAVTLNHKTAEAAIIKAAKHKYHRYVGTRHVEASCRRLRRTEYYCLVGVLGNLQDGIDNPDAGSPYVYSGPGWVYLRHGKLKPDVGSFRANDDFAPGR